MPKTASCPLATIVHFKSRQTIKTAKPAPTPAKPKATTRTSPSVSKATLLQRAFKDGQQAFRDDMSSTLPSANPYEQIDIDLVRAWNAGYGSAHATKIQKSWQRVMADLTRKAA